MAKLSNRQSKRPSFRSSTKHLFEILAELTRATNVLLSRRSMMDKYVMITEGFDPWEVNQIIDHFERRGYIRQVRNDRFRLTKKGEKRCRWYQIKNLHFKPNNKKWDGMWRIIMFDIPEKSKKDRETLRTKLREWRCELIQKSVFITPFKCEDEVLMLVRLLRIKSYVYMFFVKDLGFLQDGLIEKYKLK